MADENKVNLSPKSVKSSKKEVSSPGKQDAVPGINFVCRQLIIFQNIYLCIVANGNCSHSSPPEKPPRKRKDGVKGGEGKSKENKAKRRKRVRDAAAPKHPLSGYVRFMNDHRDRIKAENPKSNFTIVTKILAGEWSKLGSPEKQVNYIFIMFMFTIIFQSHRSLCSKISKKLII